MKIENLKSALPYFRQALARWESAVGLPAEDKGVKLAARGALGDLARGFLEYSGATFKNSSPGPFLVQNALRHILGDEWLALARPVPKKIYTVWHYQLPEDPEDKASMNSRGVFCSLIAAKNHCEAWLVEQNDEQAKVSPRFRIEEETLDMSPVESVSYWFDGQLNELGITRYEPFEGIAGKPKFNVNDIITTLPTGAIGIIASTPPTREQAIPGMDRSDNSYTVNFIGSEHSHAHVNEFLLLSPNEVPEHLREKAITLTPGLLLHQAIASNSSHRYVDKSEKDGYRRTFYHAKYAAMSALFSIEALSLKKLERPFEKWMPSGDWFIGGLSKAEYELAERLQKADRKSVLEHPIEGLREVTEKYLVVCNHAIDRMGYPINYCCARLEGEAERTCPTCPPNEYCPDLYVRRSKKGTILFRSGPQNYCSFEFCPFCADRLPKGYE